MRAAVAAALILSACAAPDSSAPRLAASRLLMQDEELFNPNDCTVAGNACGASDYAHLVGEPWGELHQAALPADARVIRYNMANTLEYAPGRINVILAANGRIAAIGCF